ncbi:MAG: DNA polymerase III subunit epsilon [Candidatus Saccharibacteria bacterium]|nr:DNA polymerase III subunit epsilon [Rhodoferax sp.]
MLPCYVMLDLETTGGNAVHDRITEIAAVRVEDGVAVERWSTLVNPGRRIPPFIQNLTGITDAMVEDAPSFEAVAAKLLALLDGAVFVAHNVRFDHGFVVNELQRLDMRLKAKTLCTVRLSRKLYPQHKSHGLDAIMQRHGLQTEARHRAMGDVDMVLAWLKQAQAELGADAVRNEAQALLLGSASVPPLLETSVYDIPDTPGVYLFFGEGPLPLYIGKSVNLRARVMSHFQAAAKVAREMRILMEVRRVEWRETAGELGALLLESRLVKEMQPVYNYQLRRAQQLMAWKLLPEPAHPLLKLVRIDEVDMTDLDQLYGVYRSKSQAMRALREIADVQGLCLHALGLESGKGACFASQIGKCRGLCAGRESPALHRVRLQMALAAQRLQSWPHPGRVGIREHHANTGRTDIHIFDHWCHVATVHNDADLADVSHTRQALAFDLDSYRLLVKRLTKPLGADKSLFHLPRQLASTYQESANYD